MFEQNLLSPSLAEYVCCGGEIGHFKLGENMGELEIKIYLYKNKDLVDILLFIKSEREVLIKCLSNFARKKKF